MQLFGIHTTEFTNDDVMLTNYVGICMTTRQIVHSTDNTLDDDVVTGDIVRETVDIEHNGDYFEFACEQGQLTEQGQYELSNLIDTTIIPSLASQAG